MGLRGEPHQSTAKTELRGEEAFSPVFHRLFGGNQTFRTGTPQVPSRFVSCSCRLLLSGVAVEKLPLLKKLPSPRDRKCPPKSRTSFLGHPGAILFGRILREGLFQHPQAITLRTPPAVTTRCPQYKRKSTSTEVKTATGLPSLMAGLNFHCFTVSIAF